MLQECKRILKQVASKYLQQKNIKIAAFYVFLRLNSGSRDLRSPKLAQMTLSLIFMLSPNFNFLGFTVSWS